MKIVVKGLIAQKLSSDFKQWSDVLEKIEEESTANTYSDVEIELASLTEVECKKLEKLFRECEIQGAKVLAADVAKYLKAASEGIENVTARTVRQSAWMLEQFIAQLPHHLVFSPDKYAGGSHVAYYIDEIKYVPERGSYSGSQHVPEHVHVRFVHIENDSRNADETRLFEEDTLGMSADKILRKAGYAPETPTLVEKLRVETELYYEVREKIGKKFLARGIGAVDLDDAAASDKLRWGGDRLHLDSFGQTPVVVDVLHESDKEANRRDSHCEVRLYRWHSWNLRYFSPSEDMLARHLEAEEDTDFQPEIEIPVHPLVPCFDFRRHKRLRVHVNNLTEYKYRRQVAEGLMLPKRDKDLIDMLVDQSANTFEDVVEGKGQSMNVLLGGAPGTGKTLSCEVFAEFKERPLYSVQCSQLGLEPHEVEEKLAIILRRANRWNAVLLLDEADVYIRARGEDLKQNAIVGVFLRMLEYAQCILFMTTNLADRVDDAVASRCVVAIHYEVPDAETQAKIWRNLADLNRLSLPDSVIKAFVARHPRISGRDVKNLLKLASFVSARDKKPIDLAALEFALQYKPTTDVKGEGDDEPVAHKPRAVR